MKLVQFPRSRSRSTLRLTIPSVWPLAYLLPPQSLLIASEPLAKGIQDNSFFIEEAYNQEPSVVQHIEFARIPTVPFRLAEGIVAQLKEQAAQIQKVSAQVEVNKSTPRVVVNTP